MKPARTVPWPHAAATLGLMLAAVLVGGPRCAKSQCGINSDCGSMHYCDDNQLCRQDCREDRDCPGGYCNINGQCLGGARPDAGPTDVQDTPLDANANADADPDAVMSLPDGSVPPPDITVDTGTDVPGAMDLSVPPLDTGVDVPVPPPLDTGVDVPLPPPLDTGVDVPVVGRGAYLDPCTSPSDCAANDCALDPGGSRFCSHPCTAAVQCGLGYQCASGHCLPDDTGTACTTASSTCHQYCFGTATNSQCTHTCTNGLDCPAGFACSGTSMMGSGGPFVCMPIEIPAGTSNCPSSLYNATTGCTARCRTALDCPQLLPDFHMGYACASTGTYNVCVPPPGLIVGSDPMGTNCSATGTVHCRSGACDTLSTPPVCIEACTLTGGCPSGWGCKYEQVTDGMPLVDLICRPAGSLPLGASCTRGGSCATAVCAPDASGAGYCTRICNDGFCPTGMTCSPSGGVLADGTPIRICTR